MRRRLVLNKETVGDLTPRDLSAVGGAAAETTPIAIGRTVQDPFTCTFVSQALENCPVSRLCTKFC